MRCFLWLLCSCLGLLAAPTKPNILFILTDDQGYGDLSAHGNPVLKTPNIDKLRAESVRFVDFQVSPTCAPTRSALLTGRHEFKNGVTHTILERERLALGAATLAEQFQKAGYRTGIFGKWHLGDEPQYQPNKRGFDEVFIHGAGGIGQSYPGSCGDVPKNSYYGPTILHNGKFVKTAGYCTDEFFAQATRWIEGEAAAKRPFLAWIATNAPHAPYNAKPEDAALYEGKGLGKDTENFFGMIHNIDQNVGRILARLEALGLAQDTLVVFMNDNGGTAGTKVFNAGMRAQ
ncbi:MAG: arylsulfatase, partial [Verrucomicrobia bacterium]|nr:arylsulfatase [Verrucomicrobiota bacterium]